jgi:Lrp/AsnC family leucine-responsive transcriptional regulator
MQAPAGQYAALDDVDLKILAMLEKDARLSNAALAEAVGLTASSVHERVKKLEHRGVIRGYVALVDPAAVGRQITACIRLTVGSPRGVDYHDAIKGVAGVCKDHSEILECHHVAGEDCYILKVRTGTTQELEQLLDVIRSGNDVQRSVTAIVLSTAKETTAVVQAPEAAPAEGRN